MKSTTSSSFCSIVIEKAFPSLTVHCTLYSWDKNSVANASNIVFPHEKVKFRTFVPFSRITYFHSRVIFVFKNATTKTFAFHLCSAFSLCFLAMVYLIVSFSYLPLFFPYCKNTFLQKENYNLVFIQFTSKGSSVNTVIFAGPIIFNPIVSGFP